MKEVLVLNKDSDQKRAGFSNKKQGSTFANNRRMFF
jgi:hypothetical protein